MKLTPLRDTVFVKRDVVTEERSASGLIIVPDNARTPLTRGVVIAVGAGAFTKDGRRIEPRIKPGDHVVFTKWQETELELEGEKILAMKEDDVLGVVEGS